jgi:arsenite methyltransferase
MQTETIPIENATVNKFELEEKVKKMYYEVAVNPHGTFHFEMGRQLAEKLGYDKEKLDAVPSPSIDSFAGVGHYFDLADINPGERILDLGSGSGMDVFIASLYTGEKGMVDGLDMTDAQLEKAKALQKEGNFENVSFYKGYIEKLPFPDSSFDVIISNGVINLSADKETVFREISRVLKKGGRMAIADIVTETQLPGNVVCDSTLWASCIGGASQQDKYREAIENACLAIQFVRDNNNYSFISKSAKGASKDYGIKSVSLVAYKI